MEEEEVRRGVCKVLASLRNYYFLYDSGNDVAEPIGAKDAMMAVKEQGIYKTQEQKKPLIEGELVDGDVIIGFKLSELEAMLLRMKTK